MKTYKYCYKTQKKNTQEFVYTLHLWVSWNCWQTASYNVKGIYEIILKKCISMQPVVLFYTDDFSGKIFKWIVGETERNKNAWEKFVVKNICLVKWVSRVIYLNFKY